MTTPCPTCGTAIDLTPFLTGRGIRRLLRRRRKKFLREQRVSEQVRQVREREREREKRKADEEHAASSERLDEMTRRFRDLRQTRDDPVGDEWDFLDKD